ncbi:hypothetical protein chiPu_0020923 [Chiloscyllium punctatum]|uniref:Uncharacterized protein n=1 Tax=Chiloscyllium punctatum TaxID=137246 RepID=A0A401RL76_CHIPU|nr:hypothetical protein [Chiloscyllium punctatum]
MADLRLIGQFHVDKGQSLARSPRCARPDSLTDDDISLFQVIDTLSSLSHTAIAQSTGIRPFPTEQAVDDEDVYKSLADLIDEASVGDDEDLYDCVYGDDEGDEVYEDLMKIEAVQAPVRTLLLIYGDYCSQVENAIKCLDEISKSRQDLRLKLEECANRANNGKFTLRDLLVVPMQRVLKSNIRPENGNSNSHTFSMHSFERVTYCSACRMLLRGIFYQGYLCTRCGAGAHKECLGRVGICSKAAGLPKMQVVRRYNGTPQPPGNTGPALHIQLGDILEVICAEAHSTWWQGKNLTTREIGFFPSDSVKPLPCVPKPTDYSGFPWYAGPMERLQAENELINRGSSTFLIRQRVKECGEYAISVKYNNEVKHIKIISRDSSFHIAENKRFHALTELVEYYKYHSLKEGFRSLDTTLRYPYKDPEDGPIQRAHHGRGHCEYLHHLVPVI